MANRRHPAIPPAKFEKPDQQRQADAVRKALEVGLRRTKNDLDSFLTLRDLKDLADGKIIINHNTYPVGYSMDEIRDGVETFTWFAWADDDKGTGFTLDRALSKTKAWVGIAPDQTIKTPSVFYGDYTWSRNQILPEEWLGELPDLDDVPLDLAEQFLGAVKQALLETDGVLNVKAQEVVNDDNETRISEVETKAVQHGSALAAHENSLVLLADEDKALASRQEQMATEFDNSVAYFNNQISLLSAEDRALARLMTLIQAEVDGNTALVWSRERAMIGYCPTGQHTEPEDCAAAGHQWIQAKPFADSVKMVGIVTNDGRTINLQTLMQTMESDTGELKARAFFGVNAEGRITGMVLEADPTNTQMNFIADKLLISNPDTAENLVYFNTQTKQMEFRGKFFLQDGFELNPAYGIHSIANTTGTFPSDAVASADFQQEFGRHPVQNDILTYYKASNPTTAQTRRYTGTAWSNAASTIHGDSIVTGSFVADKIAAGVSITAPTLNSATVNAIAGNFANVVIDETCTVRGTVYAENIEGDVVDTSVLTAPSVNANGETRRGWYFASATDNTRYPLFKIRVSKSANFDRYLRLETPLYGVVKDGSGDNVNSSRIEVSGFGQNFYGAYRGIGTGTGSVIQEPFVVTIPKGQTGDLQVTWFCQDESQNPNTLIYPAYDGKMIVSLQKKASSVSLA